MSARLVADEFDLYFAALTTALFVVIIVIVYRRRALTFDAATLPRRAAIAHRVRLVEIAGRGLVVLVGDVGHGDAQSRANARMRRQEISRNGLEFASEKQLWQANRPLDCITRARLEKAKSGGDAVLSVVPMDLYLFWRCPKKRRGEGRPGGWKRPMAEGL